MDICMCYIKSGIAYACSIGSAYELLFTFVPKFSFLCVYTWANAKIFPRRWLRFCWMKRKKKPNLTTWNQRKMCCRWLKFRRMNASSLMQSNETKVFLWKTGHVERKSFNENNTWRWTNIENKVEKNRENYEKQQTQKFFCTLNGR